MSSRDTVRAHQTGRCGCRLVLDSGQSQRVRWRRACLVPGTPEAGHVAMLEVNAARFQRLKKNRATD